MDYSVQNGPLKMDNLSENGKASPLDVLLRHCCKPLTLIDVGARWGAQSRWEALGDAADIVCFEPDKQECARLNDTPKPNVRYLPIGLADAEGERDLHVAIEPACSSLMPPVKALCDSYAPLAVMATTSTIQIPCRRLDDVLAEQNIVDVSAIKLDTQGSELMILQGGTAALSSCALVDIEVQFNPLYAGAGLFCEVDRFLRDHGFVLWRFEQLVHYAPEYIAAAASDIALACDPAPMHHIKVSNGQLFWGQAHYVRAEYPRTGVAAIARNEAIRAALMMGAYGYWDLSVELVSKTGDAALLTELRGAVEYCKA